MSANANRAGTCVRLAPGACAYVLNCGRGRYRLVAYAVGGGYPYAAVVRPPAPGAGYAATARAVRAWLGAAAGAYASAPGGAPRPRGARRRALTAMVRLAWYRTAAGSPGAVRAAAYVTACGGAAARRYGLVALPAS